MSLIPELQNLPDVSYIGGRTAATIANELTADYLLYLQEHTGKTEALALADPVRLMLLSAADMFNLLFQSVDLAGKSDLLKYAEGAALDHLGAVKKLTRMPAQPAAVTMRFSLTSARVSATGVPAGTRVSDAAGNYFFTESYFEIPPGALSGDARALAVTPGEAANGLPAGAINVLVDQTAYIAAVVNVDASSGGSAVESDADFTRRIYNAPMSYSVAGPRGAYEYWARQSRPDIEDVIAYSPAPAEVSVVFLLAGGVLPDAGDLAQMEAYLSADTIRPIADRVTASAPAETEYNITIAYYVSQTDSARAATIQQAVAAAVADYAAWQRKIGRDIIPSELIRRVMQAGARRVQLSEPVYTQVDPTGIARLGVSSVTYGGLEED